MSEPWIRVGRVPTGEIVDARLQAHFAVQIVAAVGATLLPAQDDFTHTALELGAGILWSPRLPSGHRVGLRIADLSLLVAASGPSTADAREVAGCGADELLGWLHDVLRQRTGGELPRLVPPKHELPPHPLGKGGRFKGASKVALTELAAWFQNAAEVLAQVQRDHGSSPVLCWPHHFDLATLISLADRGPLQSIGVGLSPGDEHEAEPYFYVTPWPYPKDVPELTGLEAGVWHTEGFSGAVLRAAELGLHKDPLLQRETAQAFISSGISICASLGT